jgi:5'-nucleotidase
MTFVLTNDDGVDAPGIRALLKALNGQGMIVAPQEHLSGCGHQVTTTQPIHIQKRSEMEYAIAGTPADCVRVALSHLCPDIEFVISGINAGGNLGSDAYISGTVAAAREAALHRIPAISISHYRRERLEISWDRAAALASEILTDLVQKPLEPGTFWNVNLPHLKPGEPDPTVVFCQPCTQPLPANFRVEGDYLYYSGEYAKRKRDPGSDVDVCFSGHISVTQIRV